MLPCGLLQHEPVPLHRAVFCDLVPGPGAHEDRVRADPRLDPVRLSPHREEHHGDAARRDGHGGLQLGRGGREEGSHPDPPEQERHAGRRGRAPEGQGERPAHRRPGGRRDEELAGRRFIDSSSCSFCDCTRSLDPSCSFEAIDATLVLILALVGGQPARR
jgi:hypothetical protein